MRNWENPWIKAAYVAGVTTFCTFLGCWAALAYQNDSAPAAKSTVSNDFFGLITTSAPGP